MLHDLRFALRVILKSRGFAFTAVLVLALGIGANTAIFTVIDGVMLRPLPYPHPERILVLDRQFPGDFYGGVSAAKGQFWMRQSRSFEAAALVDMIGSGVNLVAATETERVPSMRVSSGFFDMLGVAPARGRGFTAEEDRPGGACVAVIRERLWRSRFDLDPAIVGRVVTMNGEPCRITGVLPPGFRFWNEADIFMPMRAEGLPRDDESAFFLFARLKPEIAMDAGRAELQIVFARFAAANADLLQRGESGIHVERYLDRMVGDVRPSLRVLAGAVGLVLLIACANIANLLLSRATGRVKEMALRLALGASRRRLLAQLITESIVLAFAGGALGILLAYWGVPALLHLAPGGLPRADDIGVDARIAMFALLLSLITGLVFGMVPALQASRVDLNESLKEAGRGASTGATRAYTRGLLIAAEVALSVVLLAGAALLMRSFVALRGVSLGFDPHGVIVFRMSPAPRYSTTARLWDFERQALERVGSVAGVEAAATAISVPLEPIPVFPAAIPGRAELMLVEPRYFSVSPDYFRVLAIPLLRGRAFSDRDAASSEPVVIINETMARQVFRDRNPLGERVLLNGGPIQDAPRVIVGVVGDVHELGPDQPPRLGVFVPRSQVPQALTELVNHLLPVAWVVRTNARSTKVPEEVRRAVLSVDAQQPLSNYHTLESSLSGKLAQQEFTLLLMGIFAALAVMLAAVGIYGVVSYQVGQRSRELAIRIALGATREQILGSVIIQGMVPIGVGLGFGIAAAFALARVLASLLYQVSTRDPFTMSVIPLTIAAVGCLACYFPARRATRLDPMIALRSD